MPGAVAVASCRIPYSTRANRPCAPRIVSPRIRGSTSLVSKTPSTSSSRSGSPHAGPPAPSFIPQPKGGVVARERGVDRSHSRPSSTSSTSSIPHLPSKASSGGVTLRNSQQLSSATGTTGKNSSSVLDKFKFFNSKDKPATERSDKGGVSVSKRTSSSSGFSSARSERSDSSTSLCSEPNKPATSAPVDALGEAQNLNSASCTASNSPKGVSKNVGKKSLPKGTPGKNTFGRPAGKDSQDSLRAPSSRNSTLQKEKERTIERAERRSKVNDVKDDSRTSTTERRPCAKTEPSKTENATLLKTDAAAEPPENLTEVEETQLQESSTIPRQLKITTSLIPKTDKPSRNSIVSVNSNSSANSGPQSLPADLGRESKDISKTDSPSVDTSTSSLQTCQSASQQNMSSGVQMSSPGAGSGIPKPTAAVKGTSKPSKEEKKSGMCPSQSMNNISSSNKDASRSQNGTQSGTRNSNNCPVNGSSSPSPVKLSREDIYVTLHSPSPGTNDSPTQRAQTETTRTCSNLSKSDLTKSERSRDNSTSNVSIAMVSPIMSSNVLSNCAKDKTSPTKPLSPVICEDSNKADCRTSPLGGVAKNAFQEAGNCNLSSERKNSPESCTMKEDSSKDDSGDIGDKSSRVLSQDPPPELTRETSFSEENDEFMINIKPMQPIMRASPYGYMRSLGGPLSNRNFASRYHVSGLRLQGDLVNTGSSRLGLSQHILADSSRIYGIPMKRVMSGMAGGLMDVDYSSDVDPMDLASGYLSDGDVLRSGRVDDIASGYMSEGGASLYARRISSSRIKEETCGGKDPHRHKTINVLQDDSFDDSSSVSSGISDTIAEISTDDNLTGSSVSSENNVYGSLKRTTAMGHHRETSSSAKMAVIQADRCNDGHHVTSRKGSSTADGHSYSSGGGKSSGGHKSVKKTDSSMQTESSAFHSSSSAAWKKYLQQQHEHHAKNSGGESRSHEKSSSRCGGDGESGRSNKEKKSVGSSSSSSSSSGKKSNSLSNGMVEKHTGEIIHKSKHKIIVKGEDGSRMRTLNEVADNVTDKSSCRGSSGRSTSPKQNKGSCESLLQGGSQRMDPRKNQSRSAALATGANFGYLSKRQTSTSSVSSGGSGKNSGPKSKKCSMEKLPESSPKVLDNKDCTAYSEVNSHDSPGTCGSRSQSMAQISAVPRDRGGVVNNQLIGINGGTSVGNGANNKGTLERKGKVKVCANTQTTIHDLYMTGAAAHSDSEYSSLGRKNSNKQYFMTSPTIGLRDRVYGNRSILNGSPTPMSDYATLSGFHSSPRDHAATNGPRLSGPLRATDSDNYVLLDHGVTATSGASPYTWLRHSPSSGTSIASAPSARSYSGGGMTEAESMESLSSNASSVHAQIQHARATSLTHARLMMHQREMSVSPRLSRSNSIRSTKSEKLCPSMLQRTDDLTSALSTSSSIPGFHGNGGAATLLHHASQPTSPTHAGGGTSLASQGGRYLFPLSPVNPMTPSSNSGSHTGMRSSSATMSHYMGGLLSKMATKEDDIHGSSLSLVSTTSSLYSTAEEKQQHEIRKLKRELEQANEKVATLTSQLTTNVSPSIL